MIFRFVSNTKISVQLKETFKHEENLWFAHSVHLAVEFLKVHLGVVVL